MKRNPGGLTGYTSSNTSNGGAAPKPKAGAKTVRIKIPMANRVRTNFFRHARRLKEQVLKKLLGADPHG